MKFGLHSVNLHTCGYPETAARLDSAGLEQFVAATARGLGMQSH